MRVICTYCSASKDPDQGLVPAYKRYISDRIVHVQEIAEREGAHFCILSGKFGLVDWNHPLPWYDHSLLAEEVPQLVEMVKHQLGEKGITEVDYYTRSPQADANIIPYGNTIEKACTDTGIDLQVFSLPEPKMYLTIRNFKQIMEMAADARQTLIANRVQGEQAFAKLLTLFPDDGMIFFQRANAYETIGEFKLAKIDYEAAKRLFPLERWQHLAQEAMARIDQEFAAGGTIAEARRRISSLNNVDARLKRDSLVAIEKAIAEPANTTAEIRRCSETLVNQIMGKRRITSTGNLDSDIQSLKDQGIIPEIVANHLHTIRVLGNRALHPKIGEAPLQSSDVYPSVTALVAILERLNTSGK